MNALFRKIRDYLKFLLFTNGPENYLVRKIEPERIEEAFETEYQEFYGKPDIQKDMHYINNFFMPFISKLEAGDELWFYRLPSKYWKRNMGHQGYIIIRDGKMIDYIISIQN